MSGARWIENMPEAEYFGDTERLSNSRIGDWIKDRRIFRNPALKGDGTEEMAFGSYFDACITEGVDVAAQRFVPAPSRPNDPLKLIDRGRKRKEWQDFLDSLDGRRWVHPFHHYIMPEMLKALAEHHDDRCRAGSLLWPSSAGRNQVVGHWVDEVTGRAMRCRIDRLPDEPDPVWRLPVVADLKTADDASDEAWARSFYRLGYHRQGATYLDAYRAITGRHACMVWIVAERPDKPGWRPRVAVRWNVHDDPAIRIGRIQYRKALRDIAACEASGDYREDFEKESRTAQVPGWVENQYRFEGDRMDALKDKLRGVG